MTTEHLEQRLAYLERLLADRFPAVVERLRPGVDDDELDGFEAEFGCPLPEEFRVLYRWHDGIDPCLWGFPGLHDWLPVMRLSDACALWQDGWQFGFGSWWVPISFLGDSAYAIDMTGGRDRPARTLYFRLDDGVVGETESVAGMIDQVIGLIETGAVTPPDGADAEPYSHDNIDPSFTLFRHDRPGREFIPEVIEPFRFLLTRRGTAPLDVETDPAELHEQLCVVIQQLATLARNTLGRDLPFVNIGCADKYQPGSPLPHGTYLLHGGTMSMIDLMFRAFTRNHIDPNVWSEVWYEAERLAWSLSERSPSVIAWRARQQ